MSIQKKHLPIGKSAEFLGVSIDTLRRWERSGKITSKRLDGKNRFFKVSDLEKLKFGDRVNVKEAAKRLSISVSTLRRLTDEGKIKSYRGKNAYRQYKVDDLEKFVSSENKELSRAKASDTVHKSVLEQVEDKKVAPSTRFRFQEIYKHLFKAGVVFKFFYFAIGFSIVSIIVLTIAFLMQPEMTSRVLGYYHVSPQVIIPKPHIHFHMHDDQVEYTHEHSHYGGDEKHEHTKEVEYIQSDQEYLETGSVLGVQDELTHYEEETNVFGEVIKPFSVVALSAVKAISEDTYNKALPSGAMSDTHTNDIWIFGDAEIAGDIHLGGVIRHDSPVIVEESLTFVDQDLIELFDIGIYGSGLREDQGIPHSLDEALVFVTRRSENRYGMEFAFWDGDEDDNIPILILSEAQSGRGSTFGGSVQIGKDQGLSPVDGNYTRFEGFNFIDGDALGTGADLGVEHEIEAKGSVYAQENIIAQGNIGVGLDAGVSPTIALEVDSNSANTTPILKFGNIAGDTQVFRTDASPESSVTGSIGDLAIDSTNGTLYLKTSGSSNTGWTDIGTSNILTDLDKDTLIQVEESSDEDIIRFDLGGSNTITNALILGQSDGFVWNVGNDNLDFRLDGDDDDYIFYLDAEENKIGIGDSSPASLFTVGDGDLFQVNSSGAIATASGIASAGIIDFTSAVFSGASPLIFEGSTSDAYEMTFAITDPTADRTITFKDGSGTVAFTSDLASVNTTDITLTDNSTDAFLVREGTNDYIDIDTVDSSETVTFGNSITNPIFSFLGSFFNFNSNSANTSAVLGVENTGGDFQIFRVDATPEGSVTGSVGDLAVDSTNGNAYLKKTGDSTNTGWSRISTGSESGKYAGKTTTTYDGVITSGAKVSYDAVNTICAAEYTGSHVCSTDEILSTIATETFSSYSADGDVWIVEGPPGYTANANDCNAWTANDADNLGSFWSWDANSGGGRGRLTPCTSTLPVACCR